jgi:hypothetical protein
MKYMYLFFVTLALILSGVARADDKSKVEAEKMLQVLDMESMLDKVIDTALDTQIASKPEMAPYKHVMRVFFSKYMSYSALKPQLVEIYASEFSADELAEASAFYSTPTGRKFLLKVPLLMSKGAELGRQSIQNHIPELQDAVKAEAERLEALQESPVTRG